MSRSTLLGTTMTRRALMRTIALAAAASAVLPRQPQAAEPTHLDVKDPAAISVGYVEKVSQIDLKKYPSYVKGSTCENCLLLQGSTGAHYRPCNLFPGKLVSVTGWCSSWAAEI